MPRASVPSCSEAEQGSHCPDGPHHQAALSLIRGFCWGRSMMAAGGREGLTLCAGPERTVLVGRGGIVFLTWSWWRGKLFVTMLRLSHLLTDKHQARTAEWKAVLPSVGPPGGAITRLLVLSSLPPQGPDQETPPALEDSSLSEERKNPKGL